MEVLEEVRTILKTVVMPGQFEQGSGACQEFSQLRY
jgi:hypothetical protein